MKASIYNASAGSGKTYRLAYNYVRTIIRDPQNYSHILAVTFTNKATEEMKNRILKELHLLAAGKRSRYRKDLRQELKLGDAELQQRAAQGEALILHNYSRFTVLTIDRFFQRILRAFLHELDIDLNYSIELDTETLLSKSADMLIEEIRTKQELLNWMVNYAEQRIEEGKGWNLKKELTTIGKEIFKEEHRETLLTIPDRKKLKRLSGIIYNELHQLADTVIAVAKEGVRIIEEAGLTIADFPNGARSGLGLRIYSIAEGNLDLSDAQERCLRESAEGVDARWETKTSHKARSVQPTLQPIIGRLYDLYCSYCKTQRNIDLLNNTFYSFGVLGDLYKNMLTLCDSEQLMLLSETKNLLSEFITEEEAPFIYEKVGNRYKYYMIDEFQDTSLREWQNFLPLLYEAMSQTEEAVMIVGDIKQSIYRWRGGDWRILHSEAQQALATHGEVRLIPMEENYRSLPRVVQFNNHAIERVVQFNNELLNTAIAQTHAEGALTQQEAATMTDMLQHAYTFLKQNPTRNNPTAQGYVSVTHTPEKDDDLVIKRICHILDLGYKPSDIMVLVRKNDEAATIAETLLAFKSENTNPAYNFDVMTQEALLIGKAPISRFIASVMQLSLTPKERIHRAVVNQYLNRPLSEPFSEEEQQFIATLKLYSPEEAFELLSLYYHLSERSSELSYLQAMHELILNFCNNSSADLKSLLDWWNEKGHKQSMTIAKSEQTIEVCTIHKAKGLEKKVVIIPECVWSTKPKGDSLYWDKGLTDPIAQLGKMPVRYEKTPNTAFAHLTTKEYLYNCIDAVNLLYVAFTRAVEALHIFLYNKGKGNAHEVPNYYIHAGIMAILPQLLEQSELDGRYRTEPTDEVDKNGNPIVVQHWEFGEECGPAGDDLSADDAEYLNWEKEERNDPKQQLLQSYRSARPDLVLSLKSERYLEDGEESDLSPRNFGILMHKVFEEATTQTDLERSIERMKAEGLLTAADAEELRKMVFLALSNPTIGEWFDGHWEQVMTEGAILQPKATLRQGDKLVRRPDRVMIAGNRAVVVDYKFGEQRAAQYRDQIRRYGELLRQMGYTQIEGWLWYVKLGKTEKVI